MHQPSDKVKATAEALRELAQTIADEAAATARARLQAEYDAKHNAEVDRLRAEMDSQLAEIAKTATPKPNPKPLGAKKPVKIVLSKASQLWTDVATPPKGNKRELTGRSECVRYAYF